MDIKILHSSCSLTWIILISWINFLKVSFSIISFSWQRRKITCLCITDFSIFIYHAISSFFKMYQPVGMFVIKKKLGWPTFFIFYIRKKSVTLSIINLFPTYMQVNDLAIVSVYDTLLRVPLPPFIPLTPDNVQN